MGDQAELSVSKQIAPWAPVSQLPGLLRDSGLP